jgi:hypothetical protein
VERRRLAILRDIFLPGALFLPDDYPEARLWLAAARDHPDASKAARSRCPAGYPNDVAAVQALGALCSRRVMSRDLDCGPLSKLVRGDSLAVGGAPVSNKFSRHMLPRCLLSKPDEVLSGYYDASHMKFHFAQDDREPRDGRDPSIIYVKSAMEQGKWARKRDNRVKVVNRDGSSWLWPKHAPRRFDSAGRPVLDRDFLLITRLPLGNDGGDVIMITGGHGAGTRAFELLLTAAFPLSDLITLQESIGAHTHFQVLLEVCDIDHSGSTSEARRVQLPRDAYGDLIAELLPVKIDDSSTLILRGSENPELNGKQERGRAAP